MVTAVSMCVSTAISNQRPRGESCIVICCLMSCAYGGRVPHSHGVVQDVSWGGRGGGGSISPTML